MFWLLIFAALALTARALPIAPETTTPVSSLLSAELIELHQQNGGSLPQPGLGPRPPREDDDLSGAADASILLSESTIAPAAASGVSLFSADLINQHNATGWSLPKPGPSPRLTQEAPVLLSEPTITPVGAESVISPFSADLINHHKEMESSLPKPGSGSRSAYEAPILSSESTIVPVTAESVISRFSADQINQHKEMGWSLPKAGPSGPRLTRKASVPLSESTISTSTVDPNVPLFNADLIQEHNAMGWSLPKPGVKARSARAAPRALPAHKAHGPRALLPNGPYASRGIRV